MSLSDTVQIHPADFNKSSARAVEDFINTKYADKVIQKVGLCVCFHSIISLSEGLIGHGSGIVNANVEFRMIVFRPFKGEIVNATITNSDPQLGIALSHDFFEDVIIPPETLLENTIWDQDDTGTELFIWNQGSDEAGEPIKYYFDRTEKCYYRVEEEQWNDLSPQKQRHGQEEERDENPPYVIRGSMMQSGLGPTFWWVGEELNGVQEGAVGDEMEG